MTLPLRNLIPEGRAFVVGRISAASTYVTGAITTASGAAKAADNSGHWPAWLPSITVDTMVLLIGAVITVLTGLVSIWAKRQDVRAKRSERAHRELEEERARRTWVMNMLAQHGEPRMAEMFGPNWRGQDRTERRAADPVDSTLGEPS